MPWFTYRFETTICRHPVGRYYYTVVYLDPSLHEALPLDQHPRLRIEADVAGIPVKGAWQPARGRWYLMLPKSPLRQAGLRVGSDVEVAFRMLPQDHVEVPAELAVLVKSGPSLQKAWLALTAGQQRGLSHWVSSAKKPDTRATRIAQIRLILCGKAPLPWVRHKAAAATITTKDTKCTKEIS